MNTDKSKSFGPFTPQEFKNVSEWLTKNDIEFTHFRDEEAEKRFAENSPENLVNQVELRTKTYLGAIFYIKADMNLLQEEAFKKATHLTPDNIPEKFKIPHIPEATHPEEKQNRKSKWSRILLLAVVVYFVLRALKS
ncbi:MAG: hypothetical protein H7235_00065 [Bdellovibrionaceae bacterium]|nr:hypothetical protein [Pseudobdellovibrionaceae bacterium]